MYFQIYTEVEQYLRFETCKPTTKDRKRIKRISKKYLWKDDCLWHFDGRRERKVVRNQEEVTSVLQQHHNDNTHKGVGRILQEVAGRYYWGSITKDIKRWIKNCATCRETRQKCTREPEMMHCICYGCESSQSNAEDENLTFHRFPLNDPKTLELWITYANRDHWSLNSKSALCSKHFTEDCFDHSGEGISLKPDAVPTVVIASGDQQDNNEDNVDPLQDIYSLGTTDDLEHPYAMERAELSGIGDHLWENDSNGRKALPFSRYDAVERYLRTGTFSKEMNAKFKYMIKRASKHYCLEDDVLYYCRRDRRRRVLRSRAQVSAVLREYHDNQGHYGRSICIAAIAERYHWGTLMRDVKQWIGNCQLCLNMDESSQKFRCCVKDCNNHNGPVERSLGLTFHRFPFDDPERLSLWVKNTQKRKWSPSTRSTVCSNHFTEDCFERMGKEKVLKSHAVPTLSLGQPQLEAAEGLDAENNSENTQQTFFLKYDAVHKYLSTRVYPPGLNAVEKNTLRRLCKRFALHDGVLFFTTKRNQRRVVRNKEDVQATLTMYHNEMNHLDADKCIMLISKHYHWGSLKADVQRWVQRCEQCSAARAPTPQPCPSPASPACPSPASPASPSPEYSDPEDASHIQLASSSSTNSASSRGENIEPVEAVALSEAVETVPLGPGTPWHPAIKRSSSLNGTGLPSTKRRKHEEALPTLSTQDNLDETLENTSSETTPESHPPNKHRKDKVLLPMTPALLTYVPPILNIVSQANVVEAFPARERFDPLRARTVLQLCTQALLQMRKATKNESASYTRIGAGLVIYLTFFDATEEIIPRMVKTLLEAKLFHVRGREPSSVLDFPGSVLIVPQDSLTGTLKDKKFQYLQRIDGSYGERLYNNFVSECEKTLASSKRCVEAKCVVKHVVYGQKQTIHLTTEEPLTHVVEF